VTDFNGQIGAVKSGKYAERLKSRDLKQDEMKLTPSDKIVPRIKAKRPDIFLIAFKTTTNADYAEQLSRGQGLVKGSGADLVLANDTGTRRNLVLDKNGAVLCDTTDRNAALAFLVGRACPSVKTKPPGPGL
jgi:hypothetical protein